MGRRDHTLIMLRKERVLSTAGQMFPESGSTEIDLRGEQYVRLWRYGLRER